MNFKYFTIFLCWLPLSLLQAQVLKFGNGKELRLEDLQKNYKSHRISVYNYYISRSEAYYAFDFKEILRDVYANKVNKYFGIKVSTLDKYSPIIEIYKFQERKPYLAFKRADQKPFTTIKYYKDRMIDLGPFYLIWEENYKKDAARRRDHWPYKITGFSLVNEPPKRLRPVASAHEDIHWGYKNFIKQCISCHQLDGFGGQKGGELLTSSILKRRSDSYLKKFIDNPRKVDPNSKMDPFPVKIDIRKKRIIDIVKYLRYLEEERGKPIKKRKTIDDLNKVLDSSPKS